MAKTLNALVYPSAPTVVVERRMVDVATIPANKASWWKPINVVGNSSFNPASQKKIGPVTTIEENQVVDTYSIVSLNAQEISDAKDAAVNGMNGTVYAALAKILLNHENRIRDQAAPPQSQITMNQFKANIKALL